MANQISMTNENAVFNGLSTLLRENVLKPIVDFFAQKGITTSVEELAGVLRLPVSSPVSAPTLPTFSSIPPTVTNLPGLGLPQTITKRRKGTTAGPVPESECCQYRFIRGKNSGRRCESRAEAGQPFCSSCKGKKSAQQQLQNGQVGGASAPVASTAIPNFTNQFAGQMWPGQGAGIMPSLSASIPTLNQLTPGFSQPQDNTIKLQVHSLGNGLYYEKTSFLAIRMGANPNEHICCGVYNPQTGAIGPLTPEKIELCNKYKLKYVDPSTQGSQQTPPRVPSTTPQMPIVPGLGQMIPAAPTMGAHNKPQGLPIQVSSLTDASEADDDDDADADADDDE